MATDSASAEELLLNRDSFSTPIAATSGNGPKTTAQIIAQVKNYPEKRNTGQRCRAIGRIGLGCSKRLGAATGTDFKV